MKIGDIKTDKYYMKFIWSACINCGIERWVRLVKGKPRHNKCPVCGVKRELYPYKNEILYCIPTLHGLLKVTVIRLKIKNTDKEYSVWTVLILKLAREVYGNTVL